MILVIDNDDSFVETLARYVREAGFETNVVRHHAISLEELRNDPPEAIVLSPGPGRPSDVPNCLTLVRKLHSMPIFGVCLGYQIIIEAYGGATVPSPFPMHGQASELYHDQDPLFAHVPSPFKAGRYHSLMGQLPQHHPLTVIATLADGTPMAVRHRLYPHVGVLYHPESILTPEGRRMVANFLLQEVGGGQA